MKIDDSNKKYSYIITGILILTAVVAIFGAFTLGVMGFALFSDKGVHPVNTGTPYIVRNNYSEQIFSPSLNSGNDEIVLIPQSDQFGPAYVKPGSILLKDFDHLGDLDVNIEDVSGWSIKAYVTGNYDLINSTVYLSQFVNGIYDNLNGAKLSITWVETDSVSHWPYVCEADEWTGTFSLWPDCDNPILPHSSYTPDGVKIDDKKVWFDIDTYAEGCVVFTVILTHKNHISGVPNSRINI